MKENGAYRVFIGIETLNHKSCELVDKTQNILDLESRIDILQKTQNGISRITYCW